MAKLHELLAVEADLKAAHLKILEESIVTFSKKEHLFKAFIRSLEWFDADMPEAPEERTSLGSTVIDRLNYQQKHVIRFYDAVLQKETTNQMATGDIVVNGKTIAERIPAGFLLGLEKLLKQLRAVYDTMPTLPPNIDWVPDPETGEHVYKRKYPEQTYKTEKTFVPQILYEATEHHPAQVEKISESKNVGRYTKNEWCSMLPPAQKSKLLGRIDELLYAVKKARQRANSTVVQKVEIGQKLFDFING